MKTIPSNKKSLDYCAKKARELGIPYGHYIAITEGKLILETRKGVLTYENIHR